MQSTILELSHYTSDDKDSNSEWTNRVARPITLEDGDAVLLKNIYVDSRLIGSDSILLEQDVEWDIYFMYWIQGHGIGQLNILNPDTPNVTSPFQPDGLPYYLLDVRTTGPAQAQLAMKPVTDFFRIKIPQGIYQRSALADYISRQCSGLGVGSGPPPNVGNPAARFSSGMLLPYYDSNGNFTKFDICGNPATTNVLSPFQRPVYYGIKQSGNGPSFAMFYTDTYGGWQPAYWLYMTDAGVYSQTGENMVTLLTSLDNSQIITAINYNGSSYFLYSGPMIGAQDMAFVYNDNNGDGKFSWQYMHSPLINENNQVVGTYQTYKVLGNDNFTEGQLAFLNAFSGIMFIGMKTNLSDDPNNDPFFTQLGMKYSDMVPDEIGRFWSPNNIPFQSFLPFSYKDTFYKYTTRNFISLGTQISVDTVGVGQTDASYNMVSYQNIFNRAPLKKANTYIFTDSNTSMNLNASSAPISSTTNAGHYLIEINNIHLSDYWNNEKSYNIKGIVSNFFLSSDNFILSGNPDSLVYVHSGEPLTLTSMKVAILNPVTKKPAENLGPNSTIYLQITKEKKQTTQQLTETKK